MPTHSVTKRLREAQRKLLAREIDLQLGGKPEVMTTAEVASFLGLTFSSLSDGLWRYAIPHRRIGRRLLFSRSAIHAWLSGKIEERVYIDRFRNPHATIDSGIRETIEPPR